MKIDIAEARRVAALAHLRFSDSELELLAVQMTEILGYIDQLREVDLSTSPSDVHTEQADMREDIPQPGLDRSVVEANAPQWSEGFFVVPRVIGSEP